MFKNLKMFSCLAILLALFVGPEIWRLVAQNGTPHGVNVSFTPAVSSPASNVYRCPGTCTATATGWVKINSSLITASINCTPTGTDTVCFLDQSTTLTAGSTYSYAATDIDSSGNESSFSNIATVAFAVITNPGPPTGCNAKPQ